MTFRAQQVISRVGVTPTYNAAASGDTVPVGDRTFLHVKVTGSSVTVTPTAVGGEGGLSLTSPVITCAVGETLIGPLVSELFQNLSDGNCHLAWSSTSGVTFAVLTI